MASDNFRRLEELFADDPRASPSSDRNPRGSTTEDTPALPSIEGRESILAEAEAIVADRENRHGSPTETHRRIARMWEAYLDLDAGTIEAHDAATMLGLMKDARIRENPERRDNWVDRAGYSKCGFDAVDEGGAE